MAKAEAGAAARESHAVARGHRTVAPPGRSARRQPGRKGAYDIAAVETKWRARWEEAGLYQADLARAQRPYYNLMMFPYPSAEGLHVGNMYAYIGSDVHGRWRAMGGYDVFEPMGFDAFGIHSENFAIKHGAGTASTGHTRYRRPLPPTTTGRSGSSSSCLEPGWSSASWPRSTGVQTIRRCWPTSR
jgi:leucyl-tRNA synthetase